MFSRFAAAPLPINQNKGRQKTFKLSKYFLIWLQFVTITSRICTPLQVDFCSISADFGF